MTPLVQKRHEGECFVNYFRRGWQLVIVMQLFYFPFFSFQTGEKNETINYLNVEFNRPTSLSNPSWQEHNTDADFYVSNALE